MFGNMTALEGLHATLRVPASFGLEPRTTHVDTLDDESAKGQQSTSMTSLRPRRARSRVRPHPQNL